MRINKSILLFLFSYISQGCGDNIYSSIPDVSFRIECDIRQAAYSSLIIPGQFITVSKNNHGYQMGYAGLIIGQSAFPGIDNEKVFYAFDRACPVEVNPNIAVSINEDAIGKAVCPQCKTEYDLNNGGVPKGTGKEYLKRYKVIVSGDILVVSN